MTTGGHLLFLSTRCDLGGALLCGDRDIALIWDKPACCAGLCEAKMLSGEACEP